MMRITSEFAAQWANPVNVLSVLQLIGGSIVRKALAQLAGSSYFVPVAFSFGWVSYSFEALMSAFGDGRILPQPDHSSVLINTATGYRRENHSWVLGRLLRDFENQACDQAFRITVFAVQSRNPRWDWINYSGVFIMVIQCLISFLPFSLHGNWVIPVVTIFGTVLGLCDGALPQWKLEKWSARPQSSKTIALCRGNGSQHVMILISSGKSYDLEDLASARVGKARYTRSLLVMLAILRCLLLLVVSCVTKDCWYLFAIGALGMMHNLIAAGAARDPPAHGFDLSPLKTFEGTKVMKVLEELEMHYPRVGVSLLKMFFPGPLRPDEERFWTARKMRVTQGEKHSRPVSV